MESPAWSNYVSSERLFAPLPPIDWLCPTLRLSPGAPTLVGGYGYSGKSVSVQSLALSVASGSLLWGQFGVRQGRVSHWDYEQGYRLTAERYQRLAVGMGVDPRVLVGMLSAFILPSQGLDSVDDLAFMGDGVSLCVVDSWRASHPSVDESSSEVRRTLDRMTMASEKTGCLFLLLHHNRKVQKDDVGGRKQGIRGSSGFFDGSQTVYLFHSEVVGETTVVHEKDRVSGQQSDSFKLRFEDTDGGSGLRVTYVSAPEEREPSLDEKFALLMALVEEKVRAEPGLAGVEAIAMKVGRRRSEVAAVLQSLEADGKVKRIHGSGRGKSVRYYHMSYDFNGHAPF